ncbi:uncharacterized protein LOC118751487 [Rhagoletis pomonella]|uniref:uncharacterized protein LOC118751487 n=1 Tax=Rhagoletis pomonella TaxID=28610 RepID=UPI00177ED38E|nr:uncharacterized protein LOC118751487 [Rhagoletis pomonella]
MEQQQQQQANFVAEQVEGGALRVRIKRLTEHEIRRYSRSDSSGGDRSSNSSDNNSTGGEHDDAGRPSSPSEGGSNSGRQQQEIGVEDIESLESTQPFVLPQNSEDADMAAYWGAEYLANNTPHLTSEEEEMEHESSHVNVRSDDSGPSGECDGEVERAPTPITISSDEEEEYAKRQGEFSIATQDARHLGNGYVEYARHIDMRIRLYDPMASEEPLPPPQQLCLSEGAIEACTLASGGRSDFVEEAPAEADFSVAADADLVAEIERWLEEAEPRVPSEWQVHPDVGALPEELVTEIESHVNHQQLKRQSFRRIVNGQAYRVRITKTGKVTYKKYLQHTIPT